MGELLTNVLREVGKPLNFAVYLEISRVPLDHDVDTATLAGQKVIVKYLAGNGEFMRDMQIETLKKL